MQRMAYRCMSRVKRRIFYLIACYQSNVSPPLSVPRVPFPTFTNNRSWSFPLSHTTSVFLQDKRNRGNSVDSKTRWLPRFRACWKDSTVSYETVIFGKEKRKKIYVSIDNQFNFIYIQRLVSFAKYSIQPRYYFVVVSTGFVRKT